MLLASMVKWKKYTHTHSQWILQAVFLSGTTCQSSPEESWEECEGNIDGSGSSVERRRLHKDERGAELLTERSHTEENASRRMKAGLRNSRTKKEKAVRRPQTVPIRHQQPPKQEKTARSKMVAAGRRQRWRDGADSCSRGAFLPVETGGQSSGGSLAARRVTFTQTFKTQRPSITAPQDQRAWGGVGKPV